MPSDAAVSSLSAGSLSPGSLSSGSGPPGSPPGASYLRSLRPEEAIAAKDSIDIFFGKATQSKDQKSPPATPTDPLKAYWVLTIGGCFVVASVITIALRAKLPDGTPGIYLGVFGALLLALGGVYLWQSWETKRPPGASGPAPVEHATKLIKKQIDYVMGDAGAAFGPMHAEIGRAHV